MQSGQGFGAGAPHGLQLSLGCQVIRALLMLSDSLQNTTGLDASLHSKI